MKTTIHKTAIAAALMAMSAQAAIAVPSDRNVSKQVATATQQNHTTVGHSHAAMNMTAKQNGLHQLSSRSEQKAEKLNYADKTTTLRGPTRYIR